MRPREKSVEGEEERWGRKRGDFAYL